jgi:serine/threonine protein kinase
LKCPECSLENPDDTRFCGHCGTPLHPQGKAAGSPTRTLHTTAFPLVLGKTFAERYKLIQEIGRGGMGVVYKAKDDKLKRFVALKFISPLRFAEHKEKRRFIREARAAAALSHPNIGTVYEIDEHEGLSFISMEFVEGENLSKKVRSKPLPLPSVLNISIQVAEGLQEAHQKGIIHRDIKSANIIMTEKGQAKIMDFGLAKPEEGTQVTQDVETLGTVAYMAPEQATGGKSDCRTDIWSFGVVLFEMVAGEVPFRGKDEQSVIYMLLHKDPMPLTSLRSGVPLELERIVGKCLEKDPAYRYQGVSDLLADLKRLKRDMESGKTKILRPAPSRPGIPTFLKFAGFMGGGLAVLLSVYYLAVPRPDLAHLLARLRLTPFTGGNGMFLSPSWSPDGAWIIYAAYENGNLDIWKKPTEGGEATRFMSSPDNESQPAWSPDGKMIAFSSDREGNGIYLIPSDGGTPHQLTSYGENPAWSPDSDNIVFDWCGNIFLVSITQPVPKIKVVVSGTSSVPYTVWTPDGKSLVYWDRAKGDLCALALERGKPKPLKLIPSGLEVSGLSLSRDGRTLFLSLGPFGGTKNLWKVGFDHKKLQIKGDMIPLSVSAEEYIQCGASPDGNRIAFSACQSERHLWSFPLDPDSGLINGEPERLTFRSRHNYYPALSPDGRILIWTSHLTGQGVLCLKNLDTGEEQKVTREWGKTVREVGGSFSPNGRQVSYSSTLGGSYEIWHMPALGSVGLRLTRTQDRVRDTLTAWSPTGDTIVFRSNRSGNWDIWSLQVNDSSEPKRLTPWDSHELYPCWSPDGLRIAFQTDKEGNSDIWIMDSDGGNPRPYVEGPAEEGWSAWSPDGSRFYFISNRSGAFNVWVKPAGGGEEVQVTDFKALSFGLPNSVLYTKFAVSASRLIIPMETISGEIYILENVR